MFSQPHRPMPADLAVLNNHNNATALSREASSNRLDQRPTTAYRQHRRDNSSRGSLSSLSDLKNHFSLRSGSIRSKGSRNSDGLANLASSTANASSPDRHNGQSPPTLRPSTSRTLSPRSLQDDPPNTIIAQPSTSASRIRMPSRTSRFSSCSAAISSSTATNICCGIPVIP